MAKPAKSKIIISVVIFLILVLGIASLVLYSSWLGYKDRIYPRTYLGAHNLSGLKKTAALDLVKTAAEKIDDQGLRFEYNNKRITVEPAITAGPDGYAYDIFSLDPEASLQEIYKSQGDNFGAYLSYRLRTLLKDKIFPFTYQLNTDNLTKILKDNFQDQEIAATNAIFKISSDKNSDFQVEPEKIGKKLNYELAISEVEVNLQQLRNPDISMKSETDYPTVTQKDLPNLEPEAKKILGRGDLILNFNGQTWTIKPEKLATWLRSSGENNNFYLTLDLDKIKEFLKETIAPDLDKEVVLPRFSMVNARLANWQTGTDGQKLNIDNSAAKIQADFIKSGQNSVALIVDVVKTDSLNPTNNFNIQEIIGTGHSNFAGSPANRRHNIQVGAAALNGLLIKPDEEFSLVKILGNVDASTGYLPELVIKNNKTIPEYGGGLCQIGTTVFRSAIESGLPITERHNHSYRVVYYEPAGMDAAIYIPQPDVRFINDTGNYILIQARIEKNDLYFDFWGVKDGRQVFISKPTIYNIVKPEATRIVASTDLKPGEKKCTEKAHNGADAYFDYKVIYSQSATSSADTEKKVRFSSHYVPWQEVCLIGVASSTATSTNSSTASSSPLLDSTPSSSTPIISASSTP
ncbi:MAG: VanW family protein [Candidatus Falkowbacteria bacterium]|nr:VanW family protein [Candidatus Falkowbacteria bacterium]